MFHTANFSIRQVAAQDTLSRGVEVLRLFCYLTVVCMLIFVTAASRSADAALVYEDPSNSLSAQVIIQNVDEFIERQETYVGISDSTWWVKVPYGPQHTQDVLVVKNFWLPEVDLFYQTSTELKTLKSGRHVYYGDQERVTPLIIFPQITDPGVEYLYLRFKTDDVLDLSFGFQSPQSAHANELIYLALVVAAVAIVAALLIYNLMLALISKDQSYKIYSTYMGSALMHMFAAGGGLMLIPGLSQLAPTFGWTFGMLAFGFGLWLLASVLSDSFTPLFRRVFQVGLLAVVLQGLSALLLSQKIVTQISGPLIVVVALCMVILLARALYARHLLAPWLAIGWGLSTLGLILSVLTVQNIITEPLFLLGTQYGFVAEGLFFSAALAVRIKQKDAELASANARASEQQQHLLETQKHERQLQALVDELRTRKEKQAQIFSIIGHELRTPLSAMKMMQDAMNLRGLGGYAPNICDSTDAVLSIIDDLRTVINPDKAHEAATVIESPHDVVTRTLSSLEGLFKQHNLEVKIVTNQDSHAPHRFNAQALRQVVTNLTKNAALHAGARSMHVSLEATAGVDSDETVFSLKVEDDGRGIPERLREAVFGAFSRGDSRAEGTGLGLYITRELAERLGGSVRYFESPLGGAGFDVSFSLTPSTDAVVESVENDNSEILAGKRILFAEDQKTLQMLTHKSLQKAGAIVTVCDNGKQALDAFHDGEFDIILTDLMMPEMNGDELILEIRKSGFQGQIVALTAAIIGHETDKLLQAGADAVLNKPLNLDQMREVIAGLESPARVGKLS